MPATLFQQKLQSWHVALHHKGTGVQEVGALPSIMVVQGCEKLAHCLPSWLYRGVRSWRTAFHHGGTGVCKVGALPSVMEVQTYGTQDTHRAVGAQPSKAACPLQAQGLCHFLLVVFLAATCCQCLPGISLCHLQSQRCSEQSFCRHGPHSLIILSNTSA